MLDCNEIRLDEWDVVVILVLEHADNATVVNTGDEDREQIVEQVRLLLKVEREGLVVAERMLDQVSFGTGQPHISMLATLTTISLNWLCSQASAERSIMARAALS